MSGDKQGKPFIPLFSFAPWGSLILYRLKNKIILYVFSIATLAGMIIRVIFIYYQVGHPDIWVFPLTHYEAIFGGLIVGLGVLDKHFQKIPSWFLLIGGLIALWLVTTLPNIYATQWKLMLTYPLVGIGNFLILFATLKGGPGSVSTLLNNKGLGYLGKISYGLYVYHLIGIKLSSNIVNTFISSDRLLVYPTIIVMTALTVTIAISALSYQLLEKAFLRLKGRFALISSRPI